MLCGGSSSPLLCRANITATEKLTQAFMTKLSFEEEVREVPPARASPEARMQRT